MNRLFPRHILHLTKTLSGLRHCWYLLELASRERQILGMDKYMVFNYRVVWGFLGCAA